MKMDQYRAKRTKKGQNEEKPKSENKKKNYPQTKHNFDITAKKENE